MYSVRDMGQMLKSMLIHQRDSKRTVKSNFVTSCLGHNPKKKKLLKLKGTNKHTFFLKRI